MLLKIEYYFYNNKKGNLFFIPKQERDMCQSGICCGAEYYHNEQEKITMTKGMTHSWLNFDFWYRYLCNCIPASSGIMLVYASTISCLDTVTFKSFT